MHARLIVFVGLVVAVSCARGPESDQARGGLDGDSPTAQASISNPSQRVVGVEDLVRNVDSYTAEVLVEGIVSAVAPEEKRVAVIDVAEYEHCGVTSCAAYTLPVRWAGELPAVAERVRIRGRVATEGGKFLFVAAEAVTLPAGRPSR